MNEILILDFIEDGSLTPIQEVIDVTGLTYNEVLSFSKYIEINE